MLPRKTTAGFAAVGALTLAFAGGAAAADVNIYSGRQPALLQPLLDAFTKETGLTATATFIDKGLEERVRTEGANSPADLVMTVDIGRLDAAKKAGILQPVDSAILERNIPAQFRDGGKEWFGLTSRGRVAYVSKERVSDATLTYEGLADPKWKGKLCTRSAQHQYNVALVAAFLAHHGQDATKTWLTGVRDNLARKPEGGDRDQAKAVAAGECDVALGNTYYVGLMQNNEKEPEQKEWASAIRVVMPTFENGGTHVNISGVGMAKNAPNRANALKLMEWLSGPEAQRIYAETNYEYPVEPGIAVSDTVKSFGELKPDTLALDKIAAERPAATKLVDEIDFDAGPRS